MSEALTALNSLRDSRFVCWFEKVKECIDEQQRITLIPHTNGFLKFIIRKYSDGSNLRIHVWNKSQHGNAHDHRWDLASTVLQGELLESCFVPAHSTNDGLLYHVYWWKSGRLINANETKLLRIGLTNTLVPGSSYTRESTLIHRVSAIKNGTVTIVATEPPVDDRSAIVLSPLGQKPADNKTNRSEMSGHEFLHMLADLSGISLK